MRPRAAFLSRESGWEATAEARGLAMPGVQLLL